MKKEGFQNSFNYAIEGIINALRTQKNMRIHFLAAFVVMVGSLFLEVSRQELIFLFLVICFVLSMEMVNTAVEIVVDMISDEYSYKAKIAKNTAAGAVLLSSICAIFAGYLIFADKMSSLSLKFLPTIRQQPLHLIFINLGLLFILIIVLKSLTGSGAPLEGGMPSGHSALAFAIASMVIYMSSGLIIASLAFLLALISAHSRVDAGIHTFFEVLVGAVMGILLTIIIFGVL
ncbi:MAG: diacylglycerol kinase [bacterium]